MIKQMTKEEMHKLIDDNRVTVYYENYWKYPDTGDDEKTCPLLHTMFQIERKSGYILHIENVKEVEEGK